MRIGTRLSTVAVAASIVTLTLYGAWSLQLRRQQIYQELFYEEQSLATVLRGALEAALEHRHIEEARDVVEQLSSAERVYGIAVHAKERGAVAMSNSLRDLSGIVSREALDQALVDGQDRQLRLSRNGKDFLVHLLPLRPRGPGVEGVAEVWRDLEYIDVYLRETTWRLLLLAFVLALLLTWIIVQVARRSITLPAMQVVSTMERVAGGDLSIRIGTDSPMPVGELGQIARAFNQLTSRLAEAREALEMSSAERTELTSRLRRSERLATLGQVVAEVAHEIGTPLNVISGRAEEMEHLPGHEPTITANSRSIQDQSRRITRILQRLLDVARERSPSFENLPVASVLESVQDFLTPDFLAGGVRLVLRAPRDLLVRGDFDLLQQVFINLLQNALQASSRGASVEVTATVEGERILVDVQDEGQGVAPEMESRLFEAFASTKAGQGSGLGLPISLSIMRQLGGSLRHVPTPGRKGALFRATLLPAGATARPAEAAWS